jgi:chromosomal replication initiation ATPase DnaA
MSNTATAEDVTEQTVAETYEDLARIFSAVYAATNDIAMTLEVLDAHRARITVLRPGPELPQPVLAAAASVFNVPMSRLLRPGRHRDVCYARWVAAWMLRRRAWSTVKIGRFIGLDHSTILHGLRRVANDAHLMLHARAAEARLITMTGAVGRSP